MAPSHWTLTPGSSNTLYLHLSSTLQIATTWVELQYEIEAEASLPYSRRITELFLIRGLISFKQSKLLFLSSHGCKDKTLHKATATSCLTELAALKKLWSYLFKECSPLLPLKKKFIYYKLRFGYLAVLQHHRAAPLQFLFGFGQTTVGSGMSNTEGLEHEKNI